MPFNAFFNTLNPYGLPQGGVATHPTGYWDILPGKLML